MCYNQAQNQIIDYQFQCNNAILVSHDLTTSVECLNFVCYPHLDSNIPKKKHAKRACTFLLAESASYLTIFVHINVYY